MLLERLKENQAQSVAVAIKLLGHSEPRVKYFAIHTLEGLVKRGWDRLQQPQRQKLKQMSLALFARGASIGQLYLREKLCELVTQIATRAWPQRWPELMGSLFRTVQGAGGASDSVTLHSMVLMVLRNLSSLVVGFYPSVPEKRVKQVQEGLKQVMRPMQALLVKIFAAALGTASAGGAKGMAGRRMTSLCVDAAAALADWVDPIYVFGGEANGMRVEPLLPLLFRAYNTADTCRPASAVLATLCKKNTMDRYHPSLLKLWPAVAGTCDKLVQRASSDQSFAPLTRAALSPLRALLRNHAKLIAGPAHAATRQRALKVLAGAMTSRAPGLARAGVEGWLHLVRYKWNVLVDKEWRGSLTTRLVTTCLSQLPRRPWVEAQGEFSTEEEHTTAIAALRAQTQLLLAALTKLDMSLCARVTYEAARTSLRGMASATRRDAAAVAAATSRFEGIVAGVQHVSRALLSYCVRRDPKWGGEVKRPLPAPAMMAQEQYFRDVVSPDLHAAIASEPASVGLVWASLRLTSSFFVTRHNSLLAAVAALIDRGAFYTRQGQGSASGKSPAQLDKEVVQARRKALNALVTIAKARRKELSRNFGDIWGRVKKALATRGAALRPEERLLLLESQLVIASALPVQAHARFAVELLQQPMRRLDTILAETRTGGARAFASAMGLGSVSQMVAQATYQKRQALWWPTDLLCTTLRHARARKPPLGLAERVLTAARIDGQLHILGSLNALLSPSTLSRAPEALRAALQPTRVKLDASIRRLAERSAGWGSESDDAVRHVHTWVRTVRASAYKLLGDAAKSAPRALFSVVSSPERLGSTVFAGLSSMPLETIKALLDTLVSDLLAAYPLTDAAASRSYAAALRAILAGVFARLSNAWAQHVRQVQGRDGAVGGGTGDSKEAAEIAMSSLLVDATRSLAKLVCSVMCIPPGLSGVQFVRGTFYPRTPTTGDKNPLNQKNESKAKSNPHAPSEAQVVRSHRAMAIVVRDGYLRGLVGALIMAFLLWPDRDTTVTACTLAVRLIPVAMSSPQAVAALRQPLTRVFEAAIRILARLPREIQDMEHTALVSLCHELYTELVPRGCVDLREILARLPGVSREDISLLEGQIKGERKHKARQNSFKVFLYKFVVGRTAASGRCFAVRDLPEGFVRACRDIHSRAKTAGGGTAQGEQADDEGLAEAFEWLFGDR